MINLNDVLGYDNLKIYQNPDFFSFSLDSIILANYTNVRKKDKKIIDFCTGNAIVPLVLSKRCDKNIEGIEIIDSIYDLAQKSIEYNNLLERIKIYNMDVKEFCSDSSNFNTYDLVLCNPPYFKNYCDSKKNMSYEKMIARHEILIDLDDICRCAKNILKDNGNFSLIHRTDRLIEIISTLKKYNLEPKIIKFIYDSVNGNSNLVLIQSQKNGKTGLKIDSPFILYNDDKTFTTEYKLLQERVIK